RFVDWKLYGRSDRLHLKQCEEETNLRCTLLLDCSASMDYASRGVTKFDYARMLAACLSMILCAQKDAAGLIAYHEERAAYLPPRADSRHLRHIMTELENLRPARPTDPSGTLRFLGDTLKPRGMVILISDLLHPLDDMISHLRSLRARRHNVLVLQIADPAEREFPFDRSITFVDAEDAREQFAVPELIRSEYLSNRQRHFSRLKDECLNWEIDLKEFGTDEPLEDGLRHFIHFRNRAMSSPISAGLRGTRGA
ncbi:DUF58 domain-containing protein, partial [Candidatus Sumerlaeota bacterium]|nr:DUF58 domain-containing protein [Candidatus Sumerlaeota bacterium]